MERRKLLQTFGAALLGILAGQLAGKPSAAAPPSTRPNEPRVFFYDDGRHASGLYHFAPPLTPRDFTHTVDQLASSGVDTLLYMAGLEGGVVQYDSKVAQKWGDNVQQWEHPIFYRASRILHQLIADGHDPMKLLADRCHQVGIWFIASNTVCIVGGDRAADPYGRKSDFAYNNTDCYVGPDDDPRAKRLGRFFVPERMNFLRPEVRKERFLIFEELLTRYETDGIELDLSIDNEFGPICRLSEASKLAPILTDWIRDLREVAKKAEQTQGRRKRLYVRIPSGPEKVWETLGFDVARWAREKLVDGFICQGVNREFMDQNIDLTALRGVTRDSPCRLLLGFSDSLGRQLASTPTAPMIWAAALLAFEQGADGFGLCFGMWAPNGWPWTAKDYDTLRLLGHPDLLATANKVYMARSFARDAKKQELFEPEGLVLPQALTEGKSLDLQLRVADDLLLWHGQEKVASVRLRVRLTNYEHGLDEVRVELNGRLLPESILRKIDLHFRLIDNSTAVNPYGYIFEYLLPPEYFPKRGDNIIGVKLVKRDPRFKRPMDLYDVDCSINYRLHRHFERAPIEY